MFLVRQKRFKQTVQTVLKILILTFFISFIASNVFSFGFLLFVEFIQSRKAVSSLLCCYRTPETSGSPLPSLFLALLHKISFFKTISVSYLVWKEISFSVKVHLYSPSMSCFFLSPVLCFFLTPLSLWGTAVFLRSQVVNRGGIQFQGRSLIGWFEKFGWFFYPLSLSPSSFFSPSPTPPPIPPAVRKNLAMKKTISSSHTPASFFFHPFLSHIVAKHGRMACICSIQTANTWHVGVRKSSESLHSLVEAV